MLSNFVAYVPSALILYCVGLIIFFKRGRNVSHIFFFLICFCSATREILLAIETLYPQSYIGTLLIRGSFLLIAPCCGFLYYFCYFFPKRPKTIYRPFLWLTIVITICLCALSLSPILVPHTQGHTKLYIPALIFYYGSILFYFVASIDVLYKKLRGSKGPEKNQIRLVMLSIGFVIATNLLEDTLLVPFGNDTRLTNFVSGFSFALFGSATAYAMIRHRFFDIRSAVARSSAYFLIITLMVCLYIIMSYLLTRLSYRTHSPILSHVLTFCIGSAFALVFLPTKNMIDKLTNHIFFREGYDIKEVVSRYQNSLKFASEHKAILDATISLLQSSLEPKDITILPSNSIPPFVPTISLQLSFQGEIFGFLHLEEKKSGASYSNKDRRLLELITNICSLSLQNTSQYNKIKLFAETLKVEVSSATKQLSIKNRHLETLSAQKDEFMSIASHQLRPQLTAIHGFIDLLKNNQIKHSDKQEVYELMSQGAKRMMKLVSDTLHSQTDLSGTTPPNETFDIISFIDKELKQYKKQYSKNIFSINNSLFKPTFVMGSSFYTKEILQNYIDNAVIYSPDKSNITIELESTKSFIKISVIDEGVGIKKSDMSKLFNKFYWSKDALSSTPNGTGVGLFVAKKFAEAQNGSVGVSSVQGNGSTFWFLIPKVEIN